MTNPMVSDDGEPAEDTAFLRRLSALQTVSDETGRHFGGPRSP